MEITLKKSKALQNEIENISRLESATTSVHIHDPNAITKAVAATVKFKESFDSLVELNGALYTIRQLTSDANHKSGVTATLTELAKVSSMLGHVQKIQNTQCFDEAEVTAIISSNKENATGYRNDTISVWAVTAELKESAKTMQKTLQKQKMQLTDKLSELNASTKITLPKEVVDVLTKFDLI
jgi:hypothetical protein